MKSESTNYNIPSAPTPQSAVALLGLTRNTENYGVRVLLSAAIEMLALADPKSEIRLLDYGQRSESWIEETKAGKTEVRLINLRFSWRIHLPNNIFRLICVVLLSHFVPARLRNKIWMHNKWLREILENSVHFAISGGDSFSDIYGIRRFIYIALPQILVLLMKKPLVLLPQTYGPFHSWFARYIARRIILRAQALFSRDKAGVDAVNALIGLNRRFVKVVPDIGFSMSPGPLDTSLMNAISSMQNEKPLVGLNVSSLLYMGGYNGKNMFQLHDDFPALVDAIVAHAVKTLDATVLLVPHVCGGPSSQEDETHLCRKLKQRYGDIYKNRIQFLDQPMDHRQMKTLIGECSIFIGARMHACIAAVSRNVPTVCLAYSKKFKGVMEPFGEGACVTDLRTSVIASTLLAITKTFTDRDRLKLSLATTVSQLLTRQNSNFISELLPRNALDTSKRMIGASSFEVQTMETQL